MLLSILVLSLSGCNGSSHPSYTLNTKESSTTVKQVSVIKSPAFKKGETYTIYKNPTLTGMDGIKYFVSEDKSNTNPVTLNLGFAEQLGNNDKLAFVDSNNNVVFAYDPLGSVNKTDGSVKFSNGTQLSYNGLTISENNFTAGSYKTTAIEYDSSDVKYIVLKSDGTATIEGENIKEYDYVWHVSPDHDGEYYTEGLDGTDEMSEYSPDADDSVYNSYGVYIARDIIYFPELPTSGFHSVQYDDDTEYAYYYSANVSSDRIFGTLPGSTGAPGGINDENHDDGMRGDDMRGDMSENGNNQNGTLPEPPSGENGDMNPPDQNGQRGQPGGFDSVSVNIVADENNNNNGLRTDMMHSAEDAYNNPVLHITEAGTYSLSGEWKGQIWIDVGKKNNVTIILNGVTVTCDVAPAFVIKKAYECEPYDDDKGIETSTVGTKVAATANSFDVEPLTLRELEDEDGELLDGAGAIVIISDDTINKFTGANVYRLLKPEIKSSQSSNKNSEILQKKLYKMDGAFYSYVSMVIGGGSKGNGTLSITSSSYEGLDTEMHLTIVGGSIDITAPDDGINVNEDYVSVFTLDGGTLSVTSTGGDGIDSNGYIILKSGKLTISTASESGAEGALDSLDELGSAGTYEGIKWTWVRYNGSSNNPDNTVNPENSENPSTDTSNPYANYTFKTYADIGGLTDDLGIKPDTVGSTIIVLESSSSSSNNVGIVKDTEGTREASSSGSEFLFDHSVSTFSGIK